MNYIEREELAKLVREALPQVLEAGEKLGYWVAKPLKLDADGNPLWSWREVVTPDGLTFQLANGGWRNEGAISAGVAPLEGPGRRRIAPADVGGGDGPEAFASVKRSPEAIAKDLYRRVVGTADGREIARRVLNRVEETTARRVSLLAHVETLRGLGYRPAGDAVDAGECWRVPMWRDSTDLPIHQIAVSHDGSVTFEATTHVDRIGAVLEALKAPFTS